MALKVVNGTTAMIAAQPAIDSDPQRGVLRTDFYEGCDENVAITMELGFLANRVAFSSHSDGRSRVIEARTMTAAADVWQVLANEIQKSGYEHNKVIKAGGVSVADVARIKQAVIDNTDISASLAGSALKLFNLMFHEQDHFALGQYVLRHTVQTNEGFGSNVSDVNVEKLYTTTQLLDEVTDAFLWTFPLPGRLQTKLNSIPAPTAVTDFLWSWRKLPSTEITVPGNFIEITTEYWLEQWSTFYYDPIP